MEAIKVYMNSTVLSKFIKRVNPEDDFDYSSYYNHHDGLLYVEIHNSESSSVFVDSDLNILKKSFTRNGENYEFLKFREE